MRKTLALLTIVAALAVAVVAQPASSSVVAKSSSIVTVRIGDNWFVRAGASNPTVRVRKGTTVRWRWTGNAAHNVSVLRGPSKFTSPTKRSGTWSKTMRRAGTYQLWCQIHKGGQRMRLVVK